MFRDTLRNQQPVVYQTLHNALKRGTLSHCYLFVGPKGTYKKQTAFLLAKSLVCENSDPFGCEQCASCKRIDDLNYADFIYIDGSARTIRIEDVEKLQSQFEKTALEKAGHKIFVINDCENMTPKAANSLLKFIEEPYGQLTGIFITTQVDRVLPTIVSRCQNISFHPLSKKAFYESALEQGFDELTSHLVSQMVSDSNQIRTVAKGKPFSSALSSFCEFTALYFNDPGEAILYLQNAFSRMNRTDRSNSRDTFKYFIDISLIFASDYLDEYQSEDETYSALLQSARNSDFNCRHYLNTMIETRDNLNRAGNGLLLIDQMLYRLLEENK